MTIKRDLIKDAYAELGLGEYAFDLQPEDLATGMRRLNAMMAAWAGSGARLGFNAAGGMDDDAMTPVWAEDAIVTGLAVAIAPGVGKQVSPGTLARASTGMAMVMAKCSQPKERQMTGYAGAGSRFARLPSAERGIAVGNDDYYEFGEG